MNKNKVLKIVRVFFVLFGLSGAGAIADFYSGYYPMMFTKFTQPYDLIRLKNFTVTLPGIPYVLTIVTVLVFVFLLRRFYRYIKTEIMKES